MNRAATILRVLSAEGRGPLVVTLALLAILVGRLLRYGLIEPEAMAARCEAANPWWCGPRTGLIVLTQWNGVGWLSVGLCIAGGLWMLRGRPGNPALWCAVAIAGLGLVLYNATTGAFAMVAASLLLLSGAQRADHP